MMKIAIYGDSYAHDSSSRKPELHPPGSMSWGKILVRDHNRNVKNFGLSGTSLYWSANIYKTLHNNFDKNIFVATNSERLFIPHDPDNHPHWLANVVTDPKFAGTCDHLENFNYVRDYFLYVYNPQEHDYYRGLMLDSIRADKNTLILDMKTYLLPLSTSENLEFNKKNNHKAKLWNDNRFCHMSYEKNLWLAKKIDVWIDTGHFDSSDINQAPMPKNIEELTPIYFPDSTN